MSSYIILYVILYHIICHHISYHVILYHKSYHLIYIISHYITYHTISHIISYHMIWYDIIISNLSLCTQRRQMFSFAHPTPPFLQPRGCDPGTILTGNLCGLEPVWSFWKRKILSIGNRNTIPRSSRSYFTLPTEQSPHVVYLHFPVEQLYSKETNEFSEINIVWKQHTCNETLKQIPFTERERGDGALKIVGGWWRCLFLFMSTNISRLTWRKELNIYWEYGTKLKIQIYNKDCFLFITIIIEFLTSQLQLQNIHLSCDM
jgi:hypothetical protein